MLSHPRNTAEWRKTKQVFPWHEMLTVFMRAFLTLHIVLLAVDPYAGVGWRRRARARLLPVPPARRRDRLGGALRPHLHRRHGQVDHASCPAGWWLKVHRFAIVVFLMTWVHAVLAGTDGGALTPMYLATGLPILAGVAHRWWTAEVRPQRAEAGRRRPAPDPSPAGGRHRGGFLMSRDLVARIGRRALVLAATVAVLGVGVAHRPGRRRTGAPTLHRSTRRRSR